MKARRRCWFCFFAEPDMMSICLGSGDRLRTAQGNCKGGYEMSSTEISEIAEVLSRVRSWPAATRVALARRILETLESPPVEQPPPRLPRGPSAAEIAAMFRTGSPAPDDDTHRMEKYGK
jgi:hypothetical protein